MTNLQAALAKGVPSVGKLIDGLRHSLLGEIALPDGDSPAMLVKVTCAKCSEIITVRVDKANDLLCEFADVDESAQQAPVPLGFTLNKEVVGRRCQNLVRFTMRLDKLRRVVETSIEGGEFVEWHDTR